MSGEPNTAVAAARRAASTPTAVGPLDEPVPPADSGVQNAYGETSRSTSMSAGPVPTSGPAR